MAFQAITGCQRACQSCDHHYDSPDLISRKSRLLTILEISSVGILVCHKLFKHIEAVTKWTPFRRRHSQTHFLNENVRISIKISLKFVPRGPINDIPALVQIMAWHRTGDKPLSETMIVRLPTHTCVTRPQWVKLINSWKRIRCAYPALWLLMSQC